MSSNVGADLCRVTIIAPRTRVDVALPSDVPLAELLPTLLRYSGEDLPDLGLAHAGWVLQRMGETAFDTSRSVASLGVRDGEILHFRPRHDQLPELAFDDVVDAIATASRDRSGRWRPVVTRRFAFAASIVALAAGVLVLALSGPDWIVPSVVAGVVAVGLLIAGTALSRALGDAGAGAILGYMAVPYAFFAGFAGLGEHDSILRFGAPHLLVGASSALVIGVVAAFSIVEGAPGFVGVAVAGLFGALAAIVSIGFESIGPAGSAAVTVAVLLALTPLIPMFSFRLARLPLPVIPTGSDDLRAENEEVPGPKVLRQTASADRFMTGLVGSLGGVAAGCLVFISMSSGWEGPTMTSIVVATLALRARLFFGQAQRLWLLVPALTGLVLLAIRLTTSATEQATVLVAVLVPLVVVAGIFALAALRVPNRRLSPWWGRSADVFEMLFILSVVPLALAVMHLYGRIRGING